MNAIPAFLADVQHSIQLECIALVEKFTGQFVLMTDYSDTSEITYSFPLLMLEVQDAPDSFEFLGGATSMSWDFRMGVYGYNANSYGDNPTGDAELNLNPVDIVRTHFSLREWITQEMKDIEERYSFKMTYAGTHRARALKNANGLAQGFAHYWQSEAVDDGTDKIEQCVPLEHVIDETAGPE